MSDATPATADVPKPGHADHGDHHVEQRLDDLLLDRIDALRVLRADSPEQKGAILEQIAGRGKPEQDIVKELAKVRPLWRPDRFEEAHRMAMRSLEVLDRNGVRPPQMPRLGPLKPVASYIVQQMTRWIVKGYQNRLVTRLRRLYERREANTEWGSREHVMLRRARINAVQVEQGFKGDQLGLPTFLLGGAILSSVVSALRAFVDWAISGIVGVVVFAIVLAVVFASLAWAALYAAGVARRRIRLSTEQPIKALFETVGACGNPPKDDSYNFAAYAIVLLVLAWVLIPATLWVLISKA
ncbi:MAG: hypothetical protein QOH53_936 [Ilumatobacteraceae bacterium]|jgi:hypothetical protein